MGLGVEAGALGQAGEADRQGLGLGGAVVIAGHDVAIQGVGCSAGAQVYRDGQGLADGDCMVARSEAGHAVDVKHAHLHALRGGGQPIRGLEGKGVGLVVQACVVDDVLARRPFKVAGIAVKRDTGGSVLIVNEAGAYRIGIRIGTAQGEA